MSDAVRECLHDLEAIKKILPHRYPFLFVDRVIELHPGDRVVALKQVSANEAMFNGHFPERAVMPGVILLEAMAQAAAILAKCSPGYETGEGKEFFLVGANNVKWRKQVLPGDTLYLEVKWLKRKKHLLMVEARASVDGEEVASAGITAAEATV